MSDERVTWDDLQSRARVEAVEHGHLTWGTEHLVLAMTEPTILARAPRVRMILRAFGLTREGIDSFFQEEYPPDVPRGGFEPAPVYEVSEPALFETAREVAAIFAEEEVRCIHVLLAILWHRRFRANDFLAPTGLTFETGYERVAGVPYAGGVTIPRLEERPQGPRVHIADEDLKAVMDHLTALNAPVFFNQLDNGGYWVATDPAIDLEEIVAHLS